MRAGLSVLLAALMALACAPTPAKGQPSAQATFLPIADDRVVDGIAWSGSDLVASLRRAGLPPDWYRLHRIDSTNGSILGRRDPEAGDCQTLDEAGPANADGRLIWTYDCLLPLPGLNRRIEILTAPDLEAEAVILSSVRTSLSTRGLDVHGESILTSYGSRTCETLGRLGPTEIEPVSIAVSGPGGDFDTANRVTGADCVGTGVAVHPATSKDGVLAFMASTLAIGKDGPARLDTPFEVYVVTPNETTARSLGLALVNVSELAWMPDGTAILISGHGADGTGTWRVDPSTGQARRVLDFRLESVSWSDAGDRLVAVHVPEGNEQPAIVIIKTEGLVAPDS